MAKKKENNRVKVLFGILFFLIIVLVIILVVGNVLKNDDNNDKDINGNNDNVISDKVIDNVSFSNMIYTP